MPNTPALVAKQYAGHVIIAAAKQNNVPELKLLMCD
jgi:hypothetical protein